MKTIRFRFKNHPGDLFRNDSVQVLPDFHTDKENFWIWFHPNYSGSETVAYLNDLNKWVEDIGDGVENPEFEKWYGKMDLEEIMEKIGSVEKQLDLESLEGCYGMIGGQKIRIFI